MTVEDYLRATNQFPCTDWKPRNYMDEMEMDYMKAFQFANERERQREEEQAADERAAIAAGWTAEQVSSQREDPSRWMCFSSDVPSSVYLHACLQYEEACKLHVLPFTSSASRMHDFEL